MGLLFGRVCLAGCMATSFVSHGETRALFLLQKHDPLSPSTFELGAKVLNGCDLCGLCWPPLASNPPAVHPSSPAHCPVPPVCRGKKRSTPLGLRTDPQAKATTPQALYRSSHMSVGAWRGGERKTESMRKLTGVCEGEISERARRKKKEKKWSGGERDGCFSHRVGNRKREHICEG